MTNTYSKTLYVCDLCTWEYACICMRIAKKNMHRSDAISYYIEIKSYNKVYLNNCKDFVCEKPVTPC